MKFIADLHVHSRFSLAASGDLVPQQIVFRAREKGMTMVGSDGSSLGMP